mmetsp:Transcript_37885/g.96207  ORF Transcript_37885/g.96207 Transcript_37885/m.96207 type:complete len:262 (+) Transcript_37885:25-810(+)
MCSDNPNLPKEANKAKCFVISCFVFSILSIIGFWFGAPGIIGAICGILACIASSILMCCPPKGVEEGNGKFIAASVMLFIAGITQLIMGIVVIVWMIRALNEVNESTYCKDRYSNCDVDSSGTKCKDGYGSIFDGFEGFNDKYRDGVCYKDHPDHVTKRCRAQSDWDDCNKVHGDVKDAVSAIFIFFFGLTAAFFFAAGGLNVAGGVYCLKAKVAIQAMPATRMPATVGTAVPVQAQATAVPMQAQAAAVPVQAGGIDDPK